MRHSCFAYNVLTRREMYGRRLVITFIARIDIRPGDQLFIDYGLKYFQAFNKECTCEWSTDSHVPPTAEEKKASGRTSPPKPVVFDTLANMRVTWDLLNANHFPQVHANENPTYSKTKKFEIDITAGSFTTTKEFTIPRSALGNGNVTGTRTIDIDLVLRRRNGGSVGDARTTDPKGGKSTQKTANGGFGMITP